MSSCLICGTELPFGLTCPIGTRLCVPSSGMSISRTWDHRPRRHVSAFVPGAPQPPSHSDWLLCEAVGNRCTVCGGFFSEGEDLCSYGHSIGRSYRNPAA